VISAGILPYRFRQTLEVLIAHPGGPFWAGKDDGAWSVIKGLVEAEEDPRETARREFREETGWEPPPEPWIELGEVRLRSGKRVRVWAAAGDYDPATIEPGTFTTTLRGKPATFPEIDRADWFDVDTARRKLNPAYGPILDALERQLAQGG
jgi:predicted NUDIX family NTP pyrophosphohydrolase